MQIPQNNTINQINSAKFKAIDTPIKQAVSDMVAPAVTLAVYKDNALVLDAAWGWLDPEIQQNPTQTTSYFDLASVTKIYTTIALLSLITEEKVSLHTPLVEIIPEFGAINPRSINGGQNPHTKQIEPVDEQFSGEKVNPAQVTIFHLLTHTSGLPPWRDVYNVAPAPTPPTEPDDHSPQERWSRAVQRLCVYPFVAPPDTGVRYSDIGLMLLGEVVARVNNSTLNDAIAQWVDYKAVFRPMDKSIRRQQIAPTEQDPIWRKRRAWGEVHDENACGIGGVAGHAGLFAQAKTVAEMGERWLLNDYGIDPDLHAAATELQAQTGAEVRGLGWMLRSENNSSSGDLFSTNSYGHTGFTGTSLWIDPQRQLIVALLTNRVYAGRDKIGVHALRRAVHDAIVKAVD